MILTGPEIALEIQRGGVVIDPFEPVTVYRSRIARIEYSRICLLKRGRAIGSELLRFAPDASPRGQGRRALPADDLAAA
jgi:hypothetical protein